MQIKDSVILAPEELRQWLPAYYRRMGWDEHGVPTPEVLKNLDLSDYQEEYP